MSVYEKYGAAFMGFGLFVLGLYGVPETGWGQDFIVILASALFSVGAGLILAENT